MGTSSWSFPGWRGIVYGNACSESQLARYGLEAVALHPLLRAAGIDRTYYAPVRAATFAEYAKAVPGDFRFLVKAWEGLLLERFPRHERYGARSGSANPQFLDPVFATEQVISPAVEGLAAKLGTILFQFTPDRHGIFGDPPAFASRLRSFLGALPRGPLYAVELRTPSLLGADYVAALAETESTHAFVIHPAMPDLAAQHAIVGRVSDSRPLVVRWMLHAGLRYEEAARRFSPFSSLALEDPASRAAIAGLARAAAGGGRDAIVIVNNKAEGSAPLSVAKLAAEIVREDAASESAAGGAAVVSSSRAGIASSATSRDSSVRRS